MTTKTVAVQLVAMTSQYQKSMAGATASTAKLQATSSSAGKSIGSVMGPQIAVAGAVVAGVAVKMAYDWENAFTRIGAVTDTSQAQVGKWKEEVLTLAGETAIAPQKLAEALYFLASAGLDANEIMPTLAASAKASAVGLGETADIARLTANAINAYSSSGLTAAQVTDTLVAAVREGTAEPEEFASAMGRILPIASKAGISFDQVAASLAGVSNIGLDVNEGVTAMRGVIQALVAPTQQSKEALDGLGLSAQDVRDSLAEKGLIGTLRMLEDATGGDVDKMRELVPNVRALTGVFGLTTQEASKVDEIFNDVADSSGSLGKAFGETAQSPGHKLRQALVDIQVVLIELGDAVLPAAVTALSVFAQAAENTRTKLAGLGEGVKMDIHWIEELLNPAAKSHRIMVDLSEAFLAGKVSSEALGSVLKKLGDAGVLTAADFAALTRLVEHTHGGFQQGATEADRYRGDIEHMGEAAAGAEAPVGGMAGAVQGAADEMKTAEKRADDLTLALETLAGIAMDAEDAALGWHQALADLFEEAKKGSKTLDITSQAGRDNREAFLSAAEAAIEHGAAVASQTGSVQAGVKVVKDHIAQLRAQMVQAGFTAAEIDAYIHHLNLTPKQISTLITAKTQQAKTAVSSFIGDLNRIPNIKDVLIRVRSTGMGTGQQIGHSGGVVGNLPRYHGGGAVKSDEQLVLARKGETIRTVAQERALMSSRGAGSSGTTKVVVINRITPKLDRRRYGEELEQDTTYDGRWAS